MRYLFLLVAVIISFPSLKAQNVTGCGTVLPADYEHSLSLEERSVIHSVPNSQRAGIRWIGICYHIITKNDGTGGANLRDVFASHCELNEDYNPFDIGFFIQDIDTIKNTTLWNYQSSLGYSTFSQYNVAKFCNVYVNGNLPGLCGFATYPQGTSNRQGGIFLNKSCVGAGTKTFPHEMGHYLNLPHTFDTDLGVEFVNGTNCATAGDGFCDTPADFIDYRTACPYMGLETDPNGDLYKNVIDETLLMSYFSDNCVSRFSNEEQAEMNSALTNRRPYLLNQTVPDLSPLPAVTFITPINGDTSVNSSAVLFKWHSVPGAIYYNLRVQSATSTLVNVDTVLADTSFVISTLTSNKSYKFRVIPYSLGNTCGTNALYEFARTSSIKATFTITPATCPGANNAVISATATNGANPYDFFWSNGGSGSLLNNLSPGSYTVTVMDVNGEVVVANVVVNDPEQLGAEITLVGTNLAAVGTGGTAPYNYEWSNGVSGPYNNNVPFGNYTVTITDSRGCSTIETFVFSSLGVDLESTVKLSVSPNPVRSAEFLNVELQLKERMDATIVISNVNGAIIQQTSKMFESGLNTIYISTEQFTSGIYFVQLKANGGTVAKRVSVIR